MKFHRYLFALLISMAPVFLMASQAAEPAPNGLVLSLEHISEPQKNIQFRPGDEVVVVIYSPAREKHSGAIQWLSKDSIQVGDKRMAITQIRAIKAPDTKGTRILKILSYALGLPILAYGIVALISSLIELAGDNVGGGFADIVAVIGGILILFGGFLSSFIFKNRLKKIRKNGSDTGNYTLNVTEE